jgi:hypothetical protein
MNCVKKLRITIQAIKLWLLDVTRLGSLYFYKWRLKKEYARLVKMEDEVDCGRGLLEYVSSAYNEQRTKCQNLFFKCKSLEDDAVILARKKND